MWAGVRFWGLLACCRQLVPPPQDKSLLILSPARVAKIRVNPRTKAWVRAVDAIFMLFAPCLVCELLRRKSRKTCIMIVNSPFDVGQVIAKTLVKVFRRDARVFAIYGLQKIFALDRHTKSVCLDVLYWYSPTNRQLRLLASRRFGRLSHAFKRKRKSDFIRCFLGEKHSQYSKLDTLIVQKIVVLGNPYITK